MLPYNAGAFLHNKRLLKQLKSLRFCFILFKKILFVIIIFIDKLVLFVKIAVTAFFKSPSQNDNRDLPFCEFRKQELQHTPKTRKTNQNINNTSQKQYNVSIFV